MRGRNCAWLVRVTAAIICAAPGDSGNIQSAVPVCWPTRLCDTGARREISDSMVARLARERRPPSQLAGTAVRAHHRRLGVPVERVGEAHRPADGDPELRRMGDPDAP